MFLTICPYRTLQYKQCSHSLRIILSIVNWLISHVKNSCTKIKYHSIFSAINTMMIYSSAHCSWVFNMYTRYKINGTQIYPCVCRFQHKTILSKPV